MFERIRKECPNHLVVNSFGSFDCDSSAKAYKLFMKETTNEIAPIHRYLDEGATYGICQEPVDVFSADAIDTIKIIYPNKPAYLAETGGVQPRHSGPIRFYDMDKDGIIFHDAFYTPFFRGSAGSGQPWHWDVYIHKHGLWKHIKPFSQLVKGVNPIAENFKPTRLDTTKCRVWTIDGKKTILAFVRDSRNYWKSEFVDGKKLVVRVDADTANIDSRCFVLCDSSNNVIEYIRNRDVVANDNATYTFINKLQEGYKIKCSWESSLDSPIVGYVFFSSDGIEQKLQNTIDVFENGSLETSLVAIGTPSTGY
jgi:hypothetical protein